MSSHPDAAANLHPHTFASLSNSSNPHTFASLSSSNALPHSQTALSLQHFQRMHEMMMLHHRQQRVGHGNTMLQQLQPQQQQQQQQQQQVPLEHLQQQQQQQQPGSAAFDSMKPLHQVQPGPFPFLLPSPVQFPTSMDSAAGGDTSTFATMRAPAVPQHNAGMWQHMCGSSPLIEGMLKNWSQGLLAAASRGAGSGMYGMQQQLMAPAAVGAKQRKPKKAAVSSGEKKPKQPKPSLAGAEAATAVAKACLDEDAKDSALGVLSAAVDIQDGDRDEASLNAANALHEMLGGWNSSDDPANPDLFALQPPPPRLSKKRNRSLLKDLAVSVVEAGDDDGMALTPCSKGRSSKQLDSAYNHTTNPEHVCRTKDGAPVVDVHVPAVCECGSVVVGVWYRNRPHYCRWFRHARYAPLRALLEQNRRKNKSRPFDDKGPADTPGSTNDASVSCDTPAPARACESASGTPAREAQSSAAELETWGCKTSAEELLAPKFLSLLCLFQFVKHDDAVELVYPRGILGNTMTKPPSLKISADGAAGARVVSYIFFNLCTGAHIDCERSKGFVQYRWYSTELTPLIDDLSASDAQNKKVVGCCCLGHWKRKPPGREPSKTSSHLLVSSGIEIENVTACLSRVCVCVYATRV